MVIIARSRGIVLQADPSPAYGSEFSTDGNRLVRALKGNGPVCPLYPASCFAGCGAVFPFPLAPHYRRTKSESQ